MHRPKPKHANTKWKRRTTGTASALLKTMANNASRNSTHQDPPGRDPQQIYQQHQTYHNNANSNENRLTGTPSSHCPSHNCGSGCVCLYLGANVQSTDIHTTKKGGIGIIRDCDQHAPASRHSNVGLTPLSWAISWVTSRGSATVNNCCNDANLTLFEQFFTRIVQSQQAKLLPEQRAIMRGSWTLVHCNHVDLLYSKLD